MHLLCQLWCHSYSRPRLISWCGVGAGAYNSAVDNGSTVALYYDANVWGTKNGTEIIQYPPGNVVNNCTEIPGTPQRCFEMAKTTTTDP